MAGFFSSLATVLRTLDLSHTRLTASQLQAIFTSIMEGPDLSLRPTDFSPCKIIILDPKFKIGFQKYNLLFYIFVRRQMGARILKVIFFF